MARSKRATTAGSMAWSGEGLQMARAPSARAAASVPITASVGTSPWHSHTEAPQGRGARTRALAPGRARIWLSPASSTQIRATPVAVSGWTTTAERSTPSFASAAAQSCP